MPQTEGNARRAEIIAGLAQHYLDPSIDTDHHMADEYVVDLLADIRHYCDSRELDFARLDHMAYVNYIHEKEEAA